MGFRMPIQKKVEPWDLNRYLKSLGLTEADIKVSAESITGKIQETPSLAKPAQPVDARQFLKSMGMSDLDIEAWRKARKRGLSFKMDHDDKLGEHLDRLLERNAKTIYTVDTILYNTMISNSFMAASKQRFI